MSGRSIFIYTTVVVVAFLCSCGHRDETNPSSPLMPILETKGYVVPQDSMALPVTIKIDEHKWKRVEVSPSKRTLPNSNTFIANTTIKIGLVQDRVSIPGRDGFVQPVQKTILVTPGPAPFPDIVAAKPMQVMDSNPLGFRFFNSQQGLKYANIRHLMQDHLGNLWLATIGGFSKYDGKYFSNYQLTKDISDWSSYIHEDTSGNIWFGTQKGLVKYDGKTFAYFDDRDGISPDHLYFVEKSGSIWIAPKSGGITKLTPVAGQSGWPLRFTSMHFGDKEGFTDQIIDKIYEDRAGNRWFLFRDMMGMIQIKPQVDTGDRSISFLHFKMPEILQKNIPEMLEDHNGHLWFSGTGGIWKYEHDSLSFFAYSKSDQDLVAPLLADQSGNIWCNAYRNGIFRLSLPREGDDFTFTHLNIQDGLSNDRINAILEDQSGNIWIGTDNGLNLYHPKFITYLT
ncbi:MAG TPA: two-component regulator propeller domain-containing protein, partial [Saprospiraceae bacterium]|nr:two-component regulator propeller domain-containing protein [Saprospiraceae bacterium]